MATMRWKGAAQAVAQVTTVAITAYDATTTYKLTINGKTVSTSAAGSANATAAALVTAWNASTDPELAEVTASGSTSPLTLTGDTAELAADVAGEKDDEVGEQCGLGGTQLAHHRLVKDAHPRLASGLNVTHAGFAVKVADFAEKFSLANQGHGDAGVGAIRIADLHRTTEQIIEGIGVGLR